MGKLSLSAAAMEWSFDRRSFSSAFRTELNSLSEDDSSEDEEDAAIYCCVSLLL
jgi:hypothetical protein